MDTTDVISIAALIATLFIFSYQQFRQNKISKHSAYQDLEFAANELFEFEGLHDADIAPFMTVAPDASSRLPDDAIFESFLFRTLGLFEVAARSRRNGMIADTVFASWVIWYYVILCSWYFRRNWSELRVNYTEDLRLIFDSAVNNFETFPEDNERKRAFFRHVAYVVNCPVVMHWLDELRHTGETP